MFYISSHETPHTTRLDYRVHHRCSSAAALGQPYAIEISRTACKYEFGRSITPSLRRWISTKSSISQLLLLKIILVWYQRLDFLRVWFVLLVEIETRKTIPQHHPYTLPGRRLFPILPCFASSECCYFHSRMRSKTRKGRGHCFYMHAHCWNDQALVFFDPKNEESICVLTQSEYAISDQILFFYCQNLTYLRIRWAQVVRFWPKTRRPEPLDF